ncbi:hypothetical protein MJH12_05185, partial [bacterium]|nr:hypothetical protein [bacterium]
KLEILNPFLGNKDLQDLLISDLTEAEDLFKADKNKEIKRVQRVFKGMNHYVRESSNIKLGFNLILFDQETSYTENYITHYDNNEKQRKYYNPIYTEVEERKLLFGFSKYDKTFSASALVPMNDQGEVQSLSEYGTSLDIREKRVWPWEQKQSKIELTRAFGPEIFSYIPFDEWEKEKKKYNTKFFYQIYFHKSALEAWSKYSLEALKDHLTQYLTSIPLPPTPKSNYGHYKRRTWDERLKLSIDRMTQKLYDTFQSQEKSIVDLLELRENRAFATIGNGFLISLLDQNNLHDHVFVNFRWDARNSKGIYFTFGTIPKGSSFKKLEYVQSTLNNPSDNLGLNEIERRF